MTIDTPVLDRSRPPQPGVPKDVTFPDYHEQLLANGLKVILYERHDLPVASVLVVSRGASAHDGETPGLASMAMELITKGTPSLHAVDVVDRIEFLGGSIGATVGWDNSSVGISILSRNLDPAMDVLADVARNATFPDEELDRARQQRLAQILQRKSSPGALAGIQFQSAVFGGHPYARPLEGTEDSVAAMTRDALAAFHADAYHPGEVFLLAAGDMTPEHLLPLVERLFGDWSPRASVLAPVPAPQPVAATRVQVVDRPSAVQSSILVGHVGIERTNPDYIAVSVLNTLLGGYFGSRLNLNLREDKGYTYGASSRFDARLEAGPFLAGADVRNEVTDAAIEQMIAELRRLVEEEVSPAELDGVKRYVTGNFPIRIETASQVAQRILSIELYRLGKTYYNTFNSAVDAVTPAGLLAAARRYIHPDQLTIVAAGRGALLRNTLARFGPVDVFDADGIPIPTP